MTHFDQVSILMVMIVTEMFAQLMLSGDLKSGRVYG